MDRYVGKRSGHFFYLVLESKSEEFDQALRDAHPRDMVYVSDIVIDTRKVLKSRHF